MINLFNINNYKIDTSKYSNLLHDKKVKEFEDKICEYVGAKYACSFSSATNAIMLALIRERRQQGLNVVIPVPSILPPVVLNAIIHSENYFTFKDDITWVGDSYILYDRVGYKIIDSAQKLEKNQFKNEAKNNDLMVFSFYPTKPVGSCDGGMIVSNDKDKIEWFREAVLNGTGYAENNWDRIVKFPGWKMYMSSIQADMALRNFNKLEEKYEKLNKVKEYYNNCLGHNNTSMHLYRINVENNQKFINQAKDKQIMCGIHYSACHKNDIYAAKAVSDWAHNYCPKSVIESKTTVSIPYHEKLTKKELENVVRFISKYEDK